MADTRFVYLVSFQNAFIAFSKIFFSSNESTDPLVFVNNEGIDYLNNYEKTNIYFV